MIPTQSVDIFSQIEDAQASLSTSSKTMTQSRDGTPRFGKPEHRMALFVHFVCAKRHLCPSPTHGEWLSSLLRAHRNVWTRRRLFPPNLLPKACMRRACATEALAPLQSSKRARTLPTSPTQGGDGRWPPAPLCSGPPPSRRQPVFNAKATMQAGAQWTSWCHDLLTSPSRDHVAAPDFLLCHELASSGATSVSPESLPPWGAGVAMLRRAARGRKLHV